MLNQRKPRFSKGSVSFLPNLLLLSPHEDVWLTDEQQAPFRVACSTLLWASW